MKWQLPVIDNYRKIIEIFSTNIKFKESVRVVFFKFDEEGWGKTISWTKILIQSRIT